MKLNINQKRFLTETTYKLVTTVGGPFVKIAYNPLYLNLKNIPKDGDSIIFAPNHRKTVDPFVIVAAVDIPIHWAALKRFFDAEDSLFNNSKNPILCQITSKLLYGIGALPIERKDRSDDYFKCNISTIKQMISYLKMKSSVGIFPEGTTNKEPDKKDVGHIYDSFLHMAKKTNSWVLPISTVWAPKEMNVKNKVIINFREPFKVGNMKIDEALEKYKELILSGIDENKKIYTNLQEIENIVSATEHNKALQLVLKSK
ncbi:MAG: 1-acyl-sn-glycerol-3-phosphate acyltransferase [Mollicutes bacterium]|nr:1-acyl-sn-glycerol-3-phosphate acyltransferase [Mollicutes bacterium]